MNQNMKVDIDSIEKLAQRAKPVLHIHKGINEDMVATIVDPNWLADVYAAAIKGGYLDPNCTPAGQEMGFMPHSHAAFNNSGDETD